MVSPSCRRDAVVHLTVRFNVSERRACKVVGQHRSTQRLAVAPPADADLAVRARLREISSSFPRFGYRKACAIVRDEGHRVNRKRVQRLWRDEGLRVPPAPLKRHRVGVSAFPCTRLKADHINHVWALDFLFDATSDGRPLKVLSMCDEFTRESIGGTVARSITADDVVAMLEAALLVRGAPGFIRCDNGPEFIAAAIRDWCRINRIETTYIDPGSPWQNPWVESFNSRARDELFAREIFDSVRQARFLYSEWRHVYNHQRPHSSLGYLAPAVFALRCRTITIAEPS
jgi:transposase InsO family protein